MAKPAVILALLVIFVPTVLAALFLALMLLWAWKGRRRWR